jgi:predicted hydrolase (HD superfamily)
MDEGRLKHSLAVARKMVKIAKENDMPDEEIKACFIIGYNHDIGYEFAINGTNHNKVGGNILKNNDFKYWKEIYYHGIVDSNYKSIYLDILNQADMQIDKYGNDVGYDKRLEDIKNRYGEKSEIYLNCTKLINKIR